ncbi:hypothetical protein F5Y16DRAFT_425018 [Xylariaceae sp. FL0255]|nr:hypothetical protein F5Y16DRAFT_425018 [Xylariaceae sp. FL0255]
MHASSPDDQQHEDSSEHSTSPARPIDSPVQTISNQPEQSSQHQARPEEPQHGPYVQGKGFLSFKLDSDSDEEEASPGESGQTGPAPIQRDHQPLNPRPASLSSPRPTPQPTLRAVPQPSPQATVQPSPRAGPSPTVRLAAQSTIQAAPQPDSRAVPLYTPGITALSTLQRVPQPSLRPTQLAPGPPPPSAPQIAPHPTLQLYYGSANRQTGSQITNPTRRADSLPGRHITSNRRDQQSYQKPPQHKQQGGGQSSTTHDSPPGPIGFSVQSQENSGNSQTPSSSTPVSTSDAAAPTERERKTVRKFSCEQCRKAKEKCDQAGNGPCSRCARRNLQCVVTNRDNRENSTAWASLTSLRDEIRVQVNLFATVLVEIANGRDEAARTGMMRGYGMQMPLNQVALVGEIRQLRDFALPPRFQNYWRFITDPRTGLRDLRQALGDARRDGAMLLAYLEHLGEAFLEGLISSEEINRFLYSENLEVPDQLTLNAIHAFDQRRNEWVRELDEQSANFQPGSHRRRRGILRPNVQANRASPPAPKTG